MMQLSVFVEQWDLFADAVVAGAVAGGVLGALGVYIVARKMVFFSAALTQASGLGVILSILLWTLVGEHLFESLAHEHGPEPVRLATLTLGAFALAALAALGLGLRRARSDVALGAVWVGATSLILVLGGKVDRHEIPNITLWMFSGRGDSGILPEGDLARLLAVCAVVATLHGWGFRGFIASTIDPVGARVRGLPVRALDVTLMLTLAAATSSAGAILGMLPVFAYSTLPAAGALRVAPNLGWALVWATALGAVAAVVGYVTAFVLELPVGACQAVAALLLAALAAGMGRVVDLLRRSGTRTQPTAPASTHSASHSSPV